MMREVILTDIDDSTLKCSDALEAYIIENFNLTPVKHIRDTYHVNGAFEVDYETAVEMCKGFWASDQFFDLQPMPCAKEILPKLYHGNDEIGIDGFDFVAISACLDTLEVANGRLKNLNKAFGFPFRTIHCTYGMDKADILKQYKPTYWIEDFLAHSQTGGLLGHKSFLINKAYNSVDVEEAAYRRVTDWHEIYDAIKADRSRIITSKESIFIDF